jgi:predicted branched-subunit amino acid permease
MLGYAAVGFTLGIAARNAGLSAFQAGLASLLNNASAGEKAGFTVIEHNEGYIAMAIMMLIINARYLLMSCALSQKLSPKTGLISRLIIGFEVTDEIFGLSVAVDGYLNPVYTYGITLVSVAGWTCGTALGVLVGNILPDWASNAMSVSLYGMFLAIIIPPARKNSFIGLLVALSMAVSFLFSLLPVLSSISSGFKVIILTLVIAGAAAWIRPVEEEQT